MRSLIFSASILLSAQAHASQTFRDYIQVHCSRPGIRCYPEMTSWQTVGFTYEGNDHKEYFWLSEWQWKEFEKKYEKEWRPRWHTIKAVSRPVGRPYIMSAEPYTRLDELETQKYRLQVVQGACGVNLAVCSYAIAKMAGFWPGLIFTVGCSAGAIICTVAAQNTIDKINKEIDVINEGGHSSSSAPSSGSGWISGPPFNPHAIPPLPPLPNGTVTIIEHPYIP